MANLQKLNFMESAVSFRPSFLEAVENGSLNDYLSLSDAESFDKLFSLFKYSYKRYEFSIYFQRKVANLDLLPLFENIFVASYEILDSLIYGGDPYTVACHKKTIVCSIYSLLESNEKALDEYSSAFAEAEYKRELELLSE